MTVIELMNAIEDKRGDYDDPVVIVNPVAGRAPIYSDVVEVEYSASPASDTDDGGGHLRLIVSRRA